MSIDFCVAELKTTDELVSCLQSGMVLKYIEGDGIPSRFLSGYGDITNITDARSYPVLKATFTRLFAKQDEVIPILKTAGYDVKEIRVFDEPKLRSTYYSLSKKDN